MKANDIPEIEIAEVARKNIWAPDFAVLGSLKNLYEKMISKVAADDNEASWINWFVGAGGGIRLSSPLRSLIKNPILFLINFDVPKSNGNVGRKLRAPNARVLATISAAEADIKIIINCRFFGLCGSAKYAATAAIALGSAYDAKNHGSEIEAIVSRANINIGHAFFSSLIYCIMKTKVKIPKNNELLCETGYVRKPAAIE